jgi:hypothetical protein
VQVNTPDFGVPGWIDFSFYQVNAGTSLSAIATVTDFSRPVSFSIPQFRPAARV